MKESGLFEKREFVGNTPLYADGKEIIFGNVSDEIPKPVSHLNKADTTVNVWGDIVKTDVIETRNGNGSLLSFDITDYTSTVTVRIRDKKEIIESVAGRLNNSKTVIVEGSYTLDDFSQEHIIIPQSIQTVIKAEKVDNAPEQRVELHLHTTYSEMNGVTSPSAYIERAAEWGHKAIAVTDLAGVQGLPEAYETAKKLGVKLILGMEAYLVDDKKYPDYMNMKLEDTQYYNIILLIKEDNSMDSVVPKKKRKYGRKNLYELISYSYVKSFNFKPLIPKSLLTKKRENLLIGSSCERNEIAQAILNGIDKAELERIAAFYDYMEIITNGYDNITDLNNRIIELADNLNKPVVAAGNVHYLDEHEKIYRDIILNAQERKQASNHSLHFRTTDEMLAEYAWAGDRAKEFVIDNPNKIIDMIMDDISPIPDGYFPIKIENAAEELCAVCTNKIHEIYGEALPIEVSSRLNNELNAIINNGFETHFMLAMKAVEDSEKNGYYVMPRGLVGASFVAYLCEITRINPLAPHYLCENCKHTEFILDGSVKSGFDLPAKRCPHCNSLMKRDGHEIPYETFFGFDGDKDPDIDLNFSSEYQASSHKFIENMFGKDHVVKAGTLATVVDKTAYGYVMKYLDERNIVGTPRAEIDRLTVGCTGIKRTTGQHPGKLVIVPKEYTIEDFTPIQYLSNKEYIGSLSTHFSYKDTLSKTLFNIDFLAHDFPTMIKYLEESTGAMLSDIDLHDPKLYELLTSCKPLGVKAEDIDCSTGTRAILELGTPFMLQMLGKTQPKNFFDLVQVSGLSHGADLWFGNIENLIESGTCTISNVIACRDDIFTYLLHKCDCYEKETGKKSPLSRKDCFNIMEITRKNKVKDKLNSYEEALKEIGVDQWYIDSCRKIRYMFPKAHAVSYVICALQLLWYKLYYPQEFYNTYFKVYYGEKTYLSLASMSKDKIEREIEEIKQKGYLDYKTEERYYQLQLALEMLERGRKFETI